MDEIRIILENVANDTSDSVISENDLLKQEHVNGIAIGVSFGIIIFTFLITLVVYWLLIKFNASREGMNRLILCLISMAVGALLGDSVLNLIPEIYSTHYDSYGVKRDKGDPTVSSTIIISSYLAYFILEKIVKVLRNNKQQYQFEPEEDKNKSNENIPKEEIVSDNKEFPENGNKNKNTSNENLENKEYGNNPNADKILTHKDNLNENEYKDSDANFIKTNNNNINDDGEIHIIMKHENKDNNNNKINKVIKEDSQKSHLEKHTNFARSASIRFQENRSLESILGKGVKYAGIFDFKNVRTIGYITLISGGINSFLEGLIIGIVFSTRNTKDIVPTIIAIVLGLIPKRVGDAGLLLFANFTMWGVIFWNTVINLFILLGTGIGLVIGGIDRPGHYYALSFVVGGFLYIALSEMVPIKVVATGLLNIILQTAFLILGLGVMYIIITVR